MLAVGAARADVAQCGDGVAKLVLAVEEMRAEPHPRIWAEVADDPALAELAMDGGVVGRADHDGAAAARVVTRADDLEAGVVEELDEQPRERQRPCADARNADLLDHVV